jgi:hypothetical protein
VNAPLDMTDRPEPRIARALEARRRRLASATAPYAPASLADIRARLERFLAARLPFEARVVDFQPLVGGASKQHFAGPRNANARQSHAHLSNLIFAPAGYRCLARLHELLEPIVGG